MGLETVLSAATFLFARLAYSMAAWCLAVDRREPVLCRLRFAESRPARAQRSAASARSDTRPTGARKERVLFPFDSAGVGPAALCRAGMRISVFVLGERHRAEFGAARSAGVRLFDTMPAGVSCEPKRIMALPDCVRARPGNDEQFRPDRFPSGIRSCAGLDRLAPVAELKAPSAPGFVGSGRALPVFVASHCDRRFWNRPGYLLGGAQGESWQPEELCPSLSKAHNSAGELDLRGAGGVYGHSLAGKFWRYQCRWQRPDQPDDACHPCRLPARLPLCGIRSILQPAQTRRRDSRLPALVLFGSAEYRLLQRIFSFGIQARP